ncbi:hypothetical protein OS493_032298 [Desmophyllum pertusum]|uniref:Uncharacterized protein n=1 Tax=Desmophyllum pertusum TaxID=174260 RepID=A0A9X0CQE5_9CNID|nr:hypothetical protein OS493_032298 [Desmophyllum pertusum]
MKPVAPRDSTTKSVLPTKNHWGQLIVAPRWENIGTILIEEEITPMSFSEDALDCANKKEACFALGGFLKGGPLWTLLECEIECCTSDNCNTQAPTLSKDAITVFTPNASGPKECNFCLAASEGWCSTFQGDQTCTSDWDALGTTHCGSAVGKVRNKYGNVLDGFFRGCINCAGK